MTVRVPDGHEMCRFRYAKTLYNSAKSTGQGDAIFPMQPTPHHQRRTA